jgi:hypothetical protein
MGVPPEDLPISAADGSADHGCRAPASVAHSESSQRGPWAGAPMGGLARVNDGRRGDRRVDVTSYRLSLYGSDWASDGGRRK